MDKRIRPEDGGIRRIFFGNFGNISHCHMTPKPGKES
jgi:hypothetical protein